MSKDRYEFGDSSGDLDGIDKKSLARWHFVGNGTRAQNEEEEESVKRSRGQFPRRRSRSDIIAAALMAPRSPYLCLSLTLVSIPGTWVIIIKFHHSRRQWETNATPVLELTKI